MIYLDNNATTRVADEVLATMTPYYREHYGNPHSLHALGRRAHEGIEHARDELSSLIGGAGGDIVFTSCGTEGNAIAIRGLQRDTARRRIVASSVEHPSILRLLEWLAGREEIELVLVGVDSSGQLDLDAMERAVDHNTAMVAVMLTQNETGVIHPISEIARIAHSHGALLLVDAVQAVGKIAVNVDDLGADFLTVSGHKYHAPKGIGALWIRTGVRVDPLWLGGGQEHGMRSGTESVPLIAGLGAASRIAKERLGMQSGVAVRRNRLEREILGRIAGTTVNGEGDRLPNTSNISFRGLLSSLLVGALDERGICVSAGAACHSGLVEPSGVMKAMGKAFEDAVGAVRYSLSRDTTDDEISETIGATVDAAFALSPTSASV